MRLPDKIFRAASFRSLIAASIAIGLPACTAGQLADGASQTVAVNTAEMQNGPRADYPVTVGPAYMVGEVEYVPADTLNYDHVGHVAIEDGAIGYTGSHHVLPLPSYVEVTSLETGRTVLVRVERRGPMASHHLLALSPAAMAQLGAEADAAVRVRRVNPPEDHRFMLRAGDAVPLRIDTPASLLTVLQRRLPQDGTASLRPQTGIAAVSAADTPIETIELAASTAAPPSASMDSAIEANPANLVDSAGAQPVTPASTTASAAEGRFMVQAAAFSTLERAERSAEALGGIVIESGRYFRVRTGPFVTRGEAEASLANVRSAGYSDARILISG